MKKTSNRVLKTVCVLALIGIVLWVAFYAVQSYFVLTTGSGKGVINWGSPNIGQGCHQLGLSEHRFQISPVHR